ncbi:MAG TPA: hypothetical protein DDW85_08095 [Porphyromonadaceae bacterium]|nr:hypothetical protein [Porphyromonadaceae bacterium]
MTFNVIIVIAVVALGILFLLIEIFLLPGISIAGAAGGIFLIGGIVYAYLFLGSTSGNITLATSLLVLGIAFVGLVKSKSLRRIALNTDIKETVDNSDLKQIQKGDIGVTMSRLNPIGKVMIREVIVEGKSFDGEFIEEDTEIEVVKVDTYNVLVRRTKSQENL